MTIVALEVFLVLYAVLCRRRCVLLTAAAAAAAAVVDPRVAQHTNDPTRSSNVFLSLCKLYFSHVLHFEHLTA